MGTQNPASFCRPMRAWGFSMYDQTCLCASFACVAYVYFILFPVIMSELHPSIRAQRSRAYINAGEVMQTILFNIISESPYPFDRKRGTTSLSIDHVGLEVLWNIPPTVGGVESIVRSLPNTDFRTYLVLDKVEFKSAMVRQGATRGYYNQSLHFVLLPLSPR